MVHRNLRHIATYVLLMAYVPMMIASSIHIHHDTVDAPDNCGRCSGHVERQHQHQPDCQCCHFFHLHYMVPPFMRLATPPLPVATIATPAQPLLVAVGHGIAPLRAPPAA